MKILFIADCPPMNGSHQTGFGTVSYHLASALHQSGAQVTQLAINYWYNQQHEFPWKLVPHPPQSPIEQGVEQLMFRNRYDAVIALNDLWVLNQWWKVVAGYGVPFYGYFPVDSVYCDQGISRHLPLWAGVATYTRFGEQQLRENGYDGDVAIIPHGLDPLAFQPRPDARQLIGLKETPHGNLSRAFIVLNTNRNSNRKNLALTIDAFARFAQDKPLPQDGGPALWLHCGDPDVGIPVRSYYTYTVADAAQRPLITTPSDNPGHHPAVSPDTLAAYYSAANVFINTSNAEGWGLCPFEAAFCGTPSVLGKHSVHPEIWQDDAYLVEPAAWLSETLSGINTLVGIAYPYMVKRPVFTPEAFAEGLQLHYDYDCGSTEKAVQRFKTAGYDWGTVKRMFLNWVGLSA